MSTITKEWLQQKIAGMEATRDEIPFGLGEDGTNTLAALRIALASLEAEPVVSHIGSKNALDAIVAFIKSNRNPTLKDQNEVSERLFQDNCHGISNHVIEYIKQIGEELEELRSAQDSAPPAPVSVPDAMEMDDDFDSAFEHGKAVGWNACRAAMLQGAEQQNRQQNIPENIPATQFKPVADLYGLTSPTGSETSFTFDAVEARDFIDSGWSCQEYVELERYQNAVAGNSPVIPDDVRRMDWLVSKTVDVREPMVYGSHSLFWSQTITDEEDDYHATKLREQIDAAMEAEQAAAPQQEVTQALAKGMERYGDAMQKLADSGD